MYTAQRALSALHISPAPLFLHLDGGQHYTPPRPAIPHHCLLLPQTGTAHTGHNQQGTGRTEMRHMPSALLAQVLRQNGLPLATSILFPFAHLKAYLDSLDASTIHHIREMRL